MARAGRTHELPGLPATTSGGSGRLAWMDVLRGLAVGLVVLDHASAAVLSRGLPVPAAVATVNDLASPVRMPMLVFLSGMLLAPSLSRGPARYLEGKARRLLYPYVVWSAVYVVVLTRPWAYGDPYGPLALLTLLAEAPSPLWFLQFLALFYLLALLLRRVPAPVLVAGTLLASVAVPDTGRPVRFFFLFGFFLLGDLVTRSPQLWRRWLPHPAVTAGCAVLAGLLLVLALQRGTALRYQAEYAVAVLAVVLLLARVAHAVSGTRAARTLGALGRESLVVYVVHYPVAFVVVKVLQRLGVTSPALLVLAAAVCGLGAGLVAVAAARRSRLVDLLFVLPRRSDAGAGRRAQPLVPLGQPGQHPSATRPEGARRRSFPAARR